SGTTTAKVKLPPAGVTSGQWENVVPGTAAGLTGHVAITSPIQAELPPMDMGAMVGAFSGAGSAMSKPALTSGTWTCSATTLVSTPSPATGETGTWTLTRTGPG